MKSVEWYTPQWIFDGLALQFDMDPCSPFDFETFVPAKIKYTVFDNGLAKPWKGRVWLNPPYGRQTPYWMDRLIDHGIGIALVFSRTDAMWFQRAVRAADATLFLAGRIEFVPGKENVHKRSKNGAATVMFAFGEDCSHAIRRLADRGFLIDRLGKPA